jgi:hypothetical protein
MTMFHDEFFDILNKHHQQRRREFEKIACEPCMTPASVGDRVLVSAGPLGRGFEWKRIEGTVIEVADTAYRIEFGRRRYTDEPDIEWVHKFCVTDVLGPAPE